MMLFLHGNAEDLGMSFTFVRHMRDQFKVNVPALPCLPGARAAVLLREPSVQGVVGLLWALC